MISKQALIKVILPMYNKGNLAYGISICTISILCLTQFESQFSIIIEQTVTRNFA